MTEQTLTYNEARTHVHVRHPETGGRWESPVRYLPTAQEDGWVPYDPATDDDVFETSTAEGDNQTGFDPAKHTVDEVNAYLAEHAADSPGEVARVLTLERAGKNRTTIVDPIQGDDPSGD